ncbi:YfjI family protein [uncultured Thiodictyon sp.]|uniref:YfjI family protein n=1 Tax=uncultured Thiodictyon sp. TaxID=1846217 RepID=UPI0025E5AA23|nr:YfjI family protein [uncultured Thiodictyon sp.]
MDGTYSADDMSPEDLEALAGGSYHPGPDHGPEPGASPNSAHCADSAPKEPAPWQDLVPLATPKLPRLEPGSLPVWAGTYAAALASATETPAELPIGMILAAAAVPCARRLRVLVAPGHFEPCNLWLAVALPPGNRKSAVQSAACAPLVEWEREAAAASAEDIARAESEAKTLQARANKARTDAAKAKDQREVEAATQDAADLEARIQDAPKPPQLWTSDATPEKLGVMLAEQNECMAWLSSEAGLFDLLAGRYSSGIPNMDLVLKSWSGDPERVDRGGRPPVYLASPRLTIGLSPQPDVLRGLSNNPGFRGRGLLGRFFYLLPPSPLGYRDLSSDRPGARVPEPVATAYREGIRAMLDWPLAADPDGVEVPHLIRLEPAAYAEWLEFARMVEARMRPGADLEGLTDLAGKVPGGAARIAGVLHGIEHAHGKPWEAPVSLATMGRALTLAAGMLAHSAAALDLMGADESIAGARKVWEWLERGRRANSTVREAFNALRGPFPRVAGLTFALEALEERGYIRVMEPVKSGPGRPPSPRIEVRAEFAEAWR